MTPSCQIMLLFPPNKSDTHQVRGLLQLTVNNRVIGKRLSEAQAGDASVQVRQARGLLLKDALGDMRQVTQTLGDRNGRLRSLRSFKQCVRSFNQCAREDA
eukprot:1161124-Pelagomonas_calceolata.AAC.9